MSTYPENDIHAQVGRLISERDDLKAKLDAAERACAEIRDVLTKSGPPEGCGSWQMRDAWSNEKEHALSSPCGQGFVRREELDRTIKVLGGYWELSDDEYLNITEVEIARLQTLRGGTPESIRVDPVHSGHVCDDTCKPRREA